MTCEICQGRGVVTTGPRTIPCPESCPDIAYRGGAYDPANVDWHGDRESRKAFNAAGAHNMAAMYEKKEQSE